MKQIKNVFTANGQIKSLEIKYYSSSSSNKAETIKPNVIFKKSCEITNIFTASAISSPFEVKVFSSFFWVTILVIIIQNFVENFFGQKISEDLTDERRRKNHEYYYSDKNDVYS